MELLNSEEKQILLKYNQSLNREKQTFLKYSDIMLGKSGTDIQEVKESIPNSRIQKQLKTQTPPKKREQFKEIIGELNKVQTKCAENIFRMGALVEERPNLKQQSLQIRSNEKPQKQSKSDNVQLFNDKLIEQIEKLMKVKTIDNKFLIEMVKKHLRECPTFGKIVKEELKNQLNKLK